MPEDGNYVRVKEGCCQKKCVTLFLLVAVILLIVLAIVLLAGLLTKGFGTWTPDVCTTRDCARVSARVVYNMDESVDPCDDFYTYACGGFEDKETIPASMEEITPFITMVENMVKNMQDALTSKSDIDHLKSVKAIKALYQSCVDVETIEKLGIEPLQDLIKARGWWSTIDPRWRETGFDLEDYIAMMSTTGQSILRFTVTGNSFDVTEFLLQVSQGALTDLNPGMYTNLKFLDLYKKTVTALGVALGGDFTTIEAEVPKMVDFEVELSKIHDPPSFGAPKLEDIKTMEDVEKEVTSIDIGKILSRALASSKVTVNPKTRIILKNTEYFKKLGDLLKKTPKKTVAGYVMYASIKALVANLDKSTRQTDAEMRLFRTGRSAEEERGPMCANTVNKQMGFLLTRLYVDKHFKQGSKDIENLIKEMKDIFQERVASVEWLDEASRKEAIKKAEMMQLRVGYPKWILDNAKLDEETKLTLKPDEYFNNGVAVLAEVEEKKWKLLPTKREATKWETPPPLEVSRGYSQTENVLYFPLGILQLPFYDPLGPKSVNYGGIGTIVGHEITHGFDTMGRNYDASGKVRQWMTQASVNNFNKRAKCFEDEYSKIVIKQLGDVKVNGKNTLRENIADGGAIQQSFQGYQGWVGRHGHEKPLPGLNFTSNQLFFIGLAQSYCNKIKTPYLKLEARTGQRTPSNERVFGILTNTVDFAETFECKSGTKMNPEKKCSLW